MRNPRRAVALLAAVAVVAAACGNAKATVSHAGNVAGLSSSRVVLGGVASLTGPIAAAFAPIFDGVNAYFDMVNGKGGTSHVIASEPHVLLNPLAAGNTLTFQVKVHRPDGAIVVTNFEVKRTAPDKATIHCVSCGADAPVVELVKGL